MSSSKSRLHDPQLRAATGIRAAAPARRRPRRASSRARSSRCFAAWNPGSFGGRQAGLAASGFAAAPRTRRGARTAPPAPPSPAEIGQAEWLEEVRHARDAGYQDGYRGGQVALEAFKESFAKQVAAQFGSMLRDGLDDQWNGTRGRDGRGDHAHRGAARAPGRAPRARHQARDHRQGRAGSGRRDRAVRAPPARAPGTRPTTQHVLARRRRGAGRRATAARSSPTRRSSRAAASSNPTSRRRSTRRIGTRWAAAAAIYGRDDTWDAPEINLGVDE